MNQQFTESNSNFVDLSISADKLQRLKTEFRCLLEYGIVGTQFPLSDIQQLSENGRQLSMDHLHVGRPLEFINNKSVSESDRQKALELSMLITRDVIVFNYGQYFGKITANVYKSRRQGGIISNADRVEDLLRIGS